MNDKYLIKNTTREQRENIVRRSLSSGGEECAGCSACDGPGSSDAWQIYLPYIEGKKELSEINSAFRNGGTVK